MQNKSNKLLNGQSYWKQATAEIKTLRKLVFAALVIALRIVMSGLFIPVGANLRIYFSFFISALGGVVCGPVLSILIGFSADILGVMFFPSGPYFVGYTISSMLGGFVYGIFLYKRPISGVRLFMCKAVINLGVNVLLGSLWSAILYSKGYYFYMVQSLSKNLLLLPLEVVAMYLFFKLALPAAAQAEMIPKEQLNITIWGKSINP